MITIAQPDGLHPGDKDHATDMGSPGFNFNDTSSPDTLLNPDNLNRQEIIQQV